MKLYMGLFLLLFVSQVMHAMKDIITLKDIRQVQRAINAFVPFYDVDDPKREEAATTIHSNLDAVYKRVLAKLTDQEVLEKVRNPNAVDLEAIKTLKLDVFDINSAIKRKEYGVIHNRAVNALELMKALRRQIGEACKEEIEERMKPVRRKRAPKKTPPSHETLDYWNDIDDGWDIPYKKGEVSREEAESVLKEITF